MIYGIIYTRFYYFREGNIKKCILVSGTRFWYPLHHKYGHKSDDNSINLLFGSHQQRSNKQCQKTGKIQQNMIFLQKFYLLTKKHVFVKLRKSMIFQFFWHRSQHNAATHTKQYIRMRRFSQRIQLKKLKCISSPYKRVIYN